MNYTRKFLFLLILCWVALVCVPAPANTLKVLYVPGFQSGDDPQEEVLECLGKIFPNAEICTPFTWNAPSLSIWDTSRNWSNTVVEVEEVSKKLYQKIRNMSGPDRENLVIVGHSLGASVVVKALAKCDRERIQIRQFILLGAAIDNDDRDIELAIHASIQTAYSLVNMRDYALGSYLAFEGNAALGTGYLEITEPEQFCEIVSSQENEHDSISYLNRFYKCVQSQNYSSDEILVPQNWLNWRTETVDGKVMWHVLDRCKGWELQQNTVTSHCRILNPEDERMAYGKLILMKKSFEKVKHQLGPEPEEAAGPKHIDVPQDEPNAVTITMGGEICWTILDSKNGWRLQKNFFTGHCRILDPDDYRRAWGSEVNMRKSFDRVKSQLDEM